MKKGFWIIMVSILLTMGLLPISIVQASQIYYTAIDLAGDVAGEDKWMYEYVVTDNVFNAGEGFTIFFDYGKYGNITPGPNPSSDWTTTSWNPQQVGQIHQPGAYDAMAMVSAPDLLSTVFSVSFTWLDGVDGPGTQYFQLYDTNSQPMGEGYTLAGGSPQALFPGVRALCCREEEIEKLV